MNRKEFKKDLYDCIVLVSKRMAELRSQSETRNRRRMIRKVLREGRLAEHRDRLDAMDNSK